MSTQKAKFALFTRLQNLGFTYEESCQIRRIEMTLHRWYELECGDGNDYASWAIERDPDTDKPFMCRYPHDGKMTRYAIADREAGAKKRLDKIIKARNARTHAPATPIVAANALDWITPYFQTDPRGCVLYLVKRSDIPAGSTLDSCYNNGLAVAA